MLHASAFMSSLLRQPGLISMHEMCTVRHGLYLCGASLEWAFHDSRQHPALR